MITDYNQTRGSEIDQSVKGGRASFRQTGFNEEGNLDTGNRKENTKTHNAGEFEKNSVFNFRLFGNRTDFNSGTVKRPAGEQRIL